VDGQLRRQAIHRDRRQRPPGRGSPSRVGPGPRPPRGKHDLNPPDDAETLLATYADEKVLSEMIEDMQNMADFREFLRNHGVEIPGLS